MAHSDMELKAAHGHNAQACDCGHEHHEAHDGACCCAHEHHHEHEECGCGHEHHHEHEEYCCAYEHHHEHEECGCGCDHHHEHEECGCGHEHHHEHEECCCAHEHHHEHEECGCDHHHEHDECDCGHESHGHHGHSDAHGHHGAEHGRRNAKKRVYILENLGCANCAAKMEQRIAALDGVTEATITFATKQLRISAQNPDALLPEIRRICASIESEVEVVEQRESKPQHEHDEDRKDLAQIIAGAVLFVAGLLLTHLGGPEWLALVVAIVGYVLLGGKILLEAVRNMRRGHVFDENFLMSLATLGAFAIRDYFEALGVMLFYRIGEYFEHRAVERSRSQIMQAVDMRPEVVNRINGDDVQVIPAGDAQVGDVLLIRPGDRIPLDGVIVEGSSRLDTSPITGEPVPVAVGCGDAATSGCVNTSGQLKLRVEKRLEESMVSRILDSVENAAASKPKIDRFITRFARIYTPCVVLVALATAVVPPLFGGNWHYWVYTALTFLVMSCPCALVLSVPLAFFSGIGAGSRKGILFKGGAAIEALGGLKAVVMDKTGTITQGNFRVQKILSLGNYSQEALLAICAGCEQNSTHPIAHSIVTAAQEMQVSAHAPKSMEEIAGHGIDAQMDEGRVLCGNRKLMERYNVRLPEMQHEAFGSEVYVAVNGSLEGVLLISDTLKSDAKSAISRLKAMGLHTAMLTGDSEDSASAVAAETGIDQVCSRLLPQEKLERLQEIRREHGAVMFVGDGINDAPVLAGADVGAAMGSGADAAIEAADTVFMTSSVESIPEAVRIARDTNRIARQNVVFALVIKVAVMILGLYGFANMWLAVFADTGVAMLCVLNSIRALYRK